MIFRPFRAGGAPLVPACTYLSAQTNGPPPAKSKATSEKPASKPRVIISPEKLKPVVVPRFEKSPTIDGKLEDDVWKSAAIFKDFVQTSPGENIAPSKPTEVMMAYDATTLYIAFQCFDVPDKIGPIA